MQSNETQAPPAVAYYALRHGEAVHNLTPERIAGYSPHAGLTERGPEQAAELGRHLKRAGIWPDLVLVSPAPRCQDTAAACLKAMGCELEPIVDDRLRELSQGTWEGRLREEIYTPEVTARIRQEQMDFAAPGGESMNGVMRRKSELITSLPERFDDDEPKVVFGFGHGLATRIAAGHILGWTMDEMRRDITPHTSVTLFTTHDRVEWNVEFVGKVPSELEPRTIEAAGA